MYSNYCKKKDTTLSYFAQMIQRFHKFIFAKVFFLKEFWDLLSTFRPLFTFLWRRVFVLYNTWQKRRKKKSVSLFLFTFSFTHLIMLGWISSLIVTVTACSHSVTLNERFRNKEVPQGRWRKKRKSIFRPARWILVFLSRWIVVLHLVAGGNGFEWN